MDTVFPRRTFYILFMDYIRNSKNRKLKTQLLSFFSRLSFGTHRLGPAGKGIFICMISMIFSLFFPWIIFHSADGESIAYWAFSFYTGGIGYGIVVGLIMISFFLLSHEKKEIIRAYVPFRLSDSQAIVFIDAMILVSSIHNVITSLAYTRLSAHSVEAGIGMEIAVCSALLLLVASYFFSQKEKDRAVTMSYLSKSEENHLGEYAEILSWSISSQKSKDDKKNMTLPF